MKWNEYETCYETQDDFQKKNRDPEMLTKQINKSLRRKFKGKTLTRNVKEKLRLALQRLAVIILARVSKSL